MVRQLRHVAGGCPGSCWPGPIDVNCVSLLAMTSDTGHGRVLTGRGANCRVGNASGFSQCSMMMAY